MTNLGKAEIGITTFFASAHPADTCGTNGLPLTPNSIRIFGRFQGLRRVQHPNLCEYIDIVRGQHERLVVVAEHYNDSLEKHLSFGDIASLPSLQKIAYEVLLALRCLHHHKITHRNLSASTILLDPNGNVKVSKFGMYQVTGYGADVSFPIGSPCYMAPDALSMGLSTTFGPSPPAVDIWSLGMILLDVYLLGNLWAGNRNEIHKIFHKLLHLYSSPEVADGLEEILKSSFSIDRLKGMDRTFKSFIKRCLTIDPTVRPSAEDLLKHEFLQDLARLQKRSTDRQFQDELWSTCPKVKTFRSRVL